MPRISEALRYAIIAKNHDIRTQKMVTIYLMYIYRSKDMNQVFEDWEYKKRNMSKEFINIYKKVVFLWLNFIVGRFHVLSEYVKKYYTKILRKSDLFEKKAAEKPMRNNAWNQSFRVRNVVQNYVYWWISDPEV